MLEHGQFEDEKGIFIFRRSITVKGQVIYRRNGKAFKIYIHRF